MTESAHDGFFNRLVTFVEHTGTHFDAPCHMCEGGASVVLRTGQAGASACGDRRRSEGMAGQPDSVRPLEADPRVRGRHGTISDGRGGLPAHGWEAFDPGTGSARQPPGPAALPGFGLEGSALPRRGAGGGRAGRRHAGHRPGRGRGLRGPSPGHPPARGLAPGEPAEPRRRSRRSGPGSSSGSCASRAARAAPPGSWPWCPDGPDRRPMRAAEAIGHAGLLDGPHAGVNERLREARFIDHHVHSILAGRPDEDRLATTLSESGLPGGHGRHRPPAWAWRCALGARRSSGCLPTWRRRPGCDIAPAWTTPRRPPSCCLLPACRRCFAWTPAIAARSCCRSRSSRTPRGGRRAARRPAGGRGRGDGVLGPVGCRLRRRLPGRAGRATRGRRRRQVDPRLPARP